MPINVIALAIFVHSTDALHTFVDFNRLGLVLQSKALLREYIIPPVFRGLRTHAISTTFSKRKKPVVYLFKNIEIHYQ